jgi:hypothetical protein
MKQRITVKELNKLTDAQKKQLREWWVPTIGDIFITSDINMREQADEFYVIESYNDGSFEDWRFGTFHSKDESLPLLSIGQMIAFINEKKPLKSISKARFDKWIVNIETSTLGYKDELCDSLWETVTRIL